MRVSVCECTHMSVYVHVCGCAHDMAYMHVGGFAHDMHTCMCVHVHVCKDQMSAADVVSQVLSTFSWDRVGGRVN